MTTTARPIVIRDEMQTRVVIAGFVGPTRPDASDILVGAKQIVVVETLPASPDPDTVYIVTT